ncbi:hypothetical protein Barb7_00465 [Bacteroidales bacterium Barb7]|nr:hypothetical protein Barb7_00465 [Bacteroidales bacterium Barb7]
MLKAQYKIQAMTHYVLHTLFGRPFRTFPTVLPLTPHSASLHVGLKSIAPSGHLHNISK